MSINAVNAGARMWAAMSGASQRKPDTLDASNAPTQNSSALDKQLDDFVKMTPAQHLRAQLLKELGLTEDQLAKLSPDQQQAIEKKLADLAKEKCSRAKRRQRR